jgi:hypothetical protein
MTIRHVVFLKFKATATAAEIQEFITEVDRLPSVNREVRNWCSGRSVEPRFHSGDFDWALSCDLDDWDAMDRYMWHEAHLRTAPYAANTVDFMISFDFTLDCDYAAGRGVPAPLGGVPSPPPTPPPSGMVRVPIVRGRSLDDARRVLTAAGLAVSADVERVTGTVWAPNRIWACAPEEGTVVAHGVTVHLTATGDWWARPALA